MKVFTVGLDEKAPPSMNGAIIIDKASSTGIVDHTTSDKKKKNSGSSCIKALIVLIIALFLALLLTIAITELAWNRARDENYFRLRWEELKHRVAGNNHQPEPLNPQRLTIGDVTIGHQQEQDETATDTVLTKNKAPNAVLSSSAATSIDDDDDSDEVPLIESKLSSSDKLTTILEPRINMLRALIDKIREKAADSFGGGTVQVSMVAIDPSSSDMHNLFDSKDVIIDTISNNNKNHQQLPPFIQSLQQFPFQIMPMRVAFAPSQQQFGPWPFEGFASDYQEPDYRHDEMFNRRPQMMPHPDQLSIISVHPHQQLQVDDSDRMMQGKMIGSSNNRFERVLHDIMLNRMMTMMNGGRHQQMQMSPSMQMNIPPQRFGMPFQPMNVPFNQQQHQFNQMIPSSNQFQMFPTSSDDQRQLPDIHHRLPQLIENQPLMHQQQPSPFDQMNKANIFDQNDKSSSAEDDQQQRETPSDLFNFDIIELHKPPPRTEQKSTVDDGFGVIDRISGNSNNAKDVVDKGINVQSAPAIFPQFQPRFPVINTNNDQPNWWSSDSQPNQWNAPSKQFESAAGEVNIDQPMMQ